MKNTPVSALVMIGAAGLIGWVAWSMTGSDPIDVTSPVDVSAHRATPRVMALTPHEKRLKGRIEGARRQLEEFKAMGEVLPNGEIKVPDVDGSPLYIHPELFEGVGRYGEPLYAMAKYKRRAAVPLRELQSTPKDSKAQPKLMDMRANSPLKFGSAPAPGKSKVSDDDQGGDKGNSEAPKPGGN